eukprot:gb/GECG01005095.1/.p1 GENE.gb/GECG01005095.1/~~gb/GECG01005095.1/.p1  ORF type:complete len:512 (+),score=52.33 gb/GECG01005095.1/:1-1536(+)
MLNRRQTSSAGRGEEEEEKASSSSSVSSTPFLSKLGVSGGSSSSSNVRLGGNQSFGVLNTVALTIFLLTLGIAVLWVVRTVNISKDELFRDFIPSRAMVKNQVRENILRTNQDPSTKHLFLRRGNSHSQSTEKAELQEIPPGSHDDCDLLVEVSNSQKYNFYISRWLLDSTLPVGGNSRLKGIVLLFHGCSHFGDRWNLGPEERQVVVHLHKAGFAVIALTSTSARQEPDGDRCWQIFTGWELSSEPMDVSCDVDRIERANRHLIEHSADVRMVRSVVRSLLNASPLLHHVKWNAMGASSGGAFTSVLMQPYVLDDVHLDKAVIYISPMHSDVVTVMESCAQHMEVERFWPRGFPDVMFVHMPNDQAAAYEIKQQVNDLSGVGVNVEQVECPSTRIEESSFYMILGMPYEAKTEVISLLKDRKYIDENNMWLVNSRKVDMSGPLRSIVDKHWDSWDKSVSCKKGDPELKPFTKNQVVDMLVEVMHATCAYHEFTDCEAKTIRRWLAQGYKS